MQKQHLILGILIILIVFGILYLESRKVDMVTFEAGDADIVTPLSDENRERIEKKSAQYERAKEISTPDGFINTDAFQLADLVGKKVILVDFWTYSCINCQRTIPHLAEWHTAYEDDGLVIIGVHTPEFEFEKEYTNVLQAVEKFGVNYPVVLDNDFSTWRSYNNRYWPRKYLIDIDGFIVYDHIGEGSYDETEKEIVGALQERADVLGTGRSIDIGTTGNRDVSSEQGSVRTPEMYFGSSRIEYLANIPEQACLFGTCTYTDSGTIPNPNTFVFNGRWKIEKENAITVSKESSLTLHFFAQEVNIVAGSDKEAQARVYLDGELITSNSGMDASNGIVTINKHTLYNLVSLQESGAHVLKIEFLDPAIEIFTFTFG